MNVGSLKGVSLSSVSGGGEAKEVWLGREKS